MNQHETASTTGKSIIPKTSIKIRVSLGAQTDWLARGERGAYHAHKEKHW
jgi:hypothetical protein